MSNTTAPSTSATNYTSNPLELLPPTHNAWLTTGGDAALYNEILLVTATALFQHTTVFGTVFLLRGFSSKRALDLHFLTIIFALSFVFAPLIFLIDQSIDSFKLWFFLEHEAIEYLIAIMVLAPKGFVKRRAGLIVFLCWTGLCCVSIVVAFNQKYYHGADIVAWGAFVSDFLVAVAGIVLIKRWIVSRYKRRILGSSMWQGMPDDKLKRRKLAAEAMAGLGFMLHGITTVSVAPVFTRVLYYNLDPKWFAYAWVIVFITALFTVALCVPCAAIFFSTITWCCGHNRKILPGQAQWDVDELETVERGARQTGLLPKPNGYEKPWIEVNSPYTTRSGRRMSQRPTSNLYWTRLAAMHSNPAGDDGRLADAYLLR